MRGAHEAHSSSLRVAAVGNGYCGAVAMSSERLSQRFTTDVGYLAELERISKRWERPAVAPNAYDVDPRDLPKAFGRIPIVVLRKGE